VRLPFHFRRIERRNMTDCYYARKAISENRLGLHCSKIQPFL